MTAVIFPFPQHPVRVLPAQDGGWLVVSCGWLHASLEDALADSRVTAATHGAGVIAPEARAGGPSRWPEKVDRNIHPHVKPIGLITRLIAATTHPGELVVDPAAGSFVVMRAAHQLGREFVGCDLAYDAASMYRPLRYQDRAAVIAVAVLQIVDTALEHAVLWQIENYLRDEIADLECQIAAERGVSDA